MNHPSLTDDVLRTMAGDLIGNIGRQGTIDDIYTDTDWVQAYAEGTYQQGEISRYLSYPEIYVGPPIVFTLYWAWNPATDDDDWDNWDYTYYYKIV